MEEIGESGGGVVSTFLTGRSALSFTVRLPGSVLRLRDICSTWGMWQLVLAGMGGTHDGPVATKRPIIVCAAAYGDFVSPSSGSGQSY